MVVPLNLELVSVVVVDCEELEEGNSVAVTSSSSSFSVLAVGGILVVGFGYKINCFLLIIILVLPIIGDSVMEVTTLVTVLAESALSVAASSVLVGSVEAISKVVGKVLKVVVGASVAGRAFTTNTLWGCFSVVLDKDFVRIKPEGLEEEGSSEGVAVSWGSVVVVVSCGGSCSSVALST